MMLIEETKVPDAAYPVTAFRDHLQIGRGFADDAAQDALLLPILKAAVAKIEGETAKVLLSRRYKYVLAAWRDLARQSLPVAPVNAIVSLSVTDMGGGEEVAPTDGYRLAPDRHRPDIMWLGWTLPTIPVGGTAEIVFDAGFGESWSDVPADLAQAVLMLAAHYHENRSATGDRAHALPQGVASLIHPWKRFRIFGGRGR